MSKPFALDLQNIQVGTTSLEIYVPQPHLVAEAAGDTVPSLLYWTRLWPASFALAQFLIRHPLYTTNKDVLELGSGLGLPSLVACSSAARVIASDFITEAVLTIKKSAKANRINNLEARILDWHHLPTDLTTEVLLLSDVNYDQSEFDHLAKLLHRFLSAGTTVILSTPQRLSAKPFLQNLLSWKVFEEPISVNLHQQQFETMVFVLKKMN